MEKHPSRTSLGSPPPTSNIACLFLQQINILAAIKSFIPGSAGGNDGLRPQHLKDLTSASAGDAGQRLLSTDGVYKPVFGRPCSNRRSFCGAALCDLNKKDGGIRPITVGSTLRRLIAKAACKAMTSKMAARFLTVQVDFGISRATEAVAHAARAYIAGLQPGEGMLKLNFQNVFNMVRRDIIFQTVLDKMPELYPFVQLCYSAASVLTFGEYLLLSDESVQQGDPLGPLLFCVSSLKLARRMTSLGGHVSSLLCDLETIRGVGPSIGLIGLLNEDKCEIVTDDISVVASMMAIMPNIRHIPCSEAILLGAAVGDETAVDKVFSSKLAVFRLLTSRLTSLNAHDALFLLKDCFSIPKLLYSLRCASCFKSKILSEYDDVMQLTFKVVLNVDLSDTIWKQVTLPVSSGGLGVRLSIDLALPAFLSSGNSSLELTLLLLPSRLHSMSGNRDPVYIVACLGY